MLSPEDVARRVAAKRFNEGVKLVTSLLNALSVATVGAAFLLPAVGGYLNAGSALWLILALGLHLSAQTASQRLRSED